jgi:hypothetical protein
MKPPTARMQNYGLTILNSALDAEKPEDEMEVTSQDVKFWAIMAGFGVFGVLLITAVYFFPDQWILKRLLTLSIGEAFVVAAILGLTVDRYLKGDLIRKVSQDVYKYMVGYNLPAEIKGRLQALMGTALVRRNWQIAYTLIPIAESDEVLIDINFSYELENVSNTVQTYTPRIEIEKYLNPTILELRCDDPESHFRHVANPGESIGKEQGEKSGIIAAQGPGINVKPSGRNSELRYPFRGHYQLRTPSHHGDSFSFNHPSIGVTITATYPVGYKIAIESGDETVTTDNMWQFRNRAFLPSEHVMVRWFKTSNGSD